jgi:EAL domain-containing protein (putative c-di-GMP-specific phosphodiesterase class I)/GGDEF domain-containing protein
MSLDAEALWNLLGAAGWPLLVIDGQRTVRFANPQARVWLRTTGAACEGGQGEVLGAALPADAEQTLLDAEQDLWLVQRRPGLPAQAPGALLDADGLAFRLERALDTALRLGQIVSVAEFTMALYHETESLYGRREAGALLDQIRCRLASHLKRGEFAAHLGQGRMVVVSLAHGSQESAFQGAARWLEILAKPFRIGHGEHAHSVTAGVAIAPHHGRTASVLLDHAAAAAFSAARHGRGTVWPFSEAMASRMQDDMSLESALAHAIGTDEFSLVYQPKVSLIGGTCRLIGMEALLRWTSNTLGPVSPARFIPIAERAGLMPGLGRSVLEQACLQIARWRTQGWNSPPVAVNVSAQEFNQGDFRLQFDRTLKRFRIDPAAIQIEITESALLKDVEHGIHVLRSLKAEGVGLAIDDFGTGYSSLSYLRRFPADLLKIDRAFVVDAENDAGAREILGGIIRMATALNMDVVAEGVETAAQRDVLLALGCSHFQGYFFGRPMPPDELCAQWPSEREIPLERRA